jgi:hypothetical protein
MDLALHLGMTTAGLARSMSERELRDFQRYDARRGLPLRRIELYLAQIAMYVVQMASGKQQRLDDFIFKPRADEASGDADDEPTLEDIAAQFGGVVHRKG